MSKEKGTLVKRGNNVASTARFVSFRQKMIDALDKKNRVDAVRRLCLAEHKEMRKQFDSLTTLRRYYTYYRNICRELLDQKTLPVGLDILNLTTREIDLLNAQYSKKIASEHRALRPLKHHNQMILKACRLLDGVSLYDRILGLACLTGRRAAEIACTAKFQPLKKDWMLFDGQLKGKTRLLQTYEIPVLGDPALIIEGIRQIRKERPQWVDQTILFHDRGSPALSLRVKKHFSEFIDQPAVKDLRAAYAEVCYARFGSVRVAKTRFFSDILGHGQDDNITGQSYIDFYMEEAA